MKIVSPEEEAQHQRYVVNAGFKGLAGGLAVSLPASYFLNQRWPYYRALPLSLKALGVIAVSVPAFAVAAEQASLRFDRAHWSDKGKIELDEQAERERARLQALNTPDRIAEWSKRNQYSIIGTSWLGGMSVASAVIMRDRQQTFAQKIVQVRMWAQGITIAVVIAAGVLTHRDREAKRESQRAAVDHSWADIVAISERNNNHPSQGKQ